MADQMDPMLAAIMQVSAATIKEYRAMAKEFLERAEKAEERMFQMMVHFKDIETRRQMDRNAEEEAMRRQVEAMKKADDRASKEKGKSDDPFDAFGTAFGGK
jgi:hypothetical protein